MVRHFILNKFESNQFNFQDTATDEQTILNEIYPLSWTTRLVYVWQGAWLIYSLVYVMRRLPNGVRVLDEIDLLHNGVFVYFSLGQVALTVWLLLQFNGFISVNRFQYFLKSLILLKLFSFIILDLVFIVSFGDRTNGGVHCRLRFIQDHV